MVRYILFEIERYVSGRAFDYASDKYDIEHVLPEHPGENWAGFTDEQIDRCVYRIGNLTLIAAGPNRDVGNGTYADKRPAYEQSEFDLTKRVATEHTDWTPDSIASRQHWLANQATSIWRLAELA